MFLLTSKFLYVQNDFVYFAINHTVLTLSHICTVSSGEDVIDIVLELLSANGTKQVVWTWLRLLNDIWMLLLLRLLLV